MSQTVQPNPNNGISAPNAMELLRRARQQPECAQAETALRQATDALTKANTEHVDEQGHVNDAICKYGLFAICGTLMSSMYLLSKSGLSGTPALVGLVG